MKLHLWIGIVLLAMSGYGLDWSYTLNIKTNPWEATLGYGKNAAISTLTEGDITVPRSIDGYPVVALNTNAFYQCSKLNSVTIQDNIKKIGTGCFYECYGLESVAMPNTITQIPDAMFSHCTNLLSATIPTSVSSIGRSAFWCCYNLQCIEIPNVTRIADSAFGLCRNITSITFPSTLRHVEGTAFDDCTNLDKIVISDLSRFSQITSTMRVRSTFTSGYVTSYSRPKLFMDGKQLTDIVIPSGTTSIGSYSVLSWCRDIRNLVIPDSVVTVGSHAFSTIYPNDSDLESVVIGDGVTDLGDYAFWGCGKLTNIVMGAGVKRIGVHCFDGCNFKDIALGTAVETIGGWAFQECAELKSVFLPSTVTNIGSGAFAGCNKLSKIYLATNYTGNVTNTIGHVPAIIRYVPEQRLTLNACGGVVTQPHLTVKFNSAYGALPEPVRDGYLFDGWFYNGERITTQSIVRAIDDHELIAAWKPIKYGVAFDANGGTGEMGGIEVEYDSVTNLPLNVFRCPKMVFAGWATNATGEVVYADGASISNVCTDAGAVQTLFAVWSPLVVDAPVMTPGDGFVFRTDSCLVTLSCATEGAAIYYSTNGTTPRTSAANAYNGPFATPVAVTVIAVAVCDGVKSAYMTASLTKGAPLAPVITPTDGHVFVGDSCEVTIACPTESATIYYTVDGSMPQRSETCRYTGPFSISSTTTIRAFAANDTFDGECVAATISKWALTLADAVGAPSLVFSTGGDSQWTPIADASAASGYSAKSGVIGEAEPGGESMTWLETSVSGSGSFSFQWKVSCEHDDFGDCTWDRLMVFTNGFEVARIDGESGWKAVNFRFEDTGAHTIRWAFIKDDFNEEQFPDVAWVSGVVWTPDEGGNVDPIPEIKDDSEVVVALASSSDSRLIENIKTAAEYNAFRAWVVSKGLNHQAVENSPHAWASYVLGTSVLLANEPTIEMMDVVVDNGDGGLSSSRSLVVEVMVKDGGAVVFVDADNLAAMFEATAEVGDWSGAARLEPVVRKLGESGGVLRFGIVPGDGTAEKAFIRIRK